MQSYQKLKDMIAGIDEDVNKAAGGNKAAGTRVRQAMQEIKKTAQEVRQAILDLRSAEQGQAKP